MVKYLIVANISLNESIPIIGNFFQIAHIHNYGAAFSIFQNMQTFLIFITIGVSAALLFYMLKMMKTGHFSMLLALAGIIGGGIGNLIDRIRLGYVVDFLQFGSFPVFNVADMAVVGGSALLIFYVIFIDMKQPKGGEIDNE